MEAAAAHDDGIVELSCVVGAHGGVAVVDDGGIAAMQGVKLELIRFHEDAGL